MRYLGQNRLSMPILLTAWVSASLSLSVSACGPTGETVEATESKSQPIWHASDDGNDPWSNATVALFLDNGNTVNPHSQPPATTDIPSCTGTLITGRLVLTANHCMQGTDKVLAANMATAEVYFGNDRTAFTTANSARILNFRSPLQGPTIDDTHRDVAIVELDRTIVSEAYAIKPRFSTYGLDVCTGCAFDMDVAYAGWGQNETGGVKDLRQIQNYPHGNPLRVYHMSSLPSYALWIAHWDDTYYGGDHGDSGGPLYLLLDSYDWVKQRDVIGVDQGHANDDWPYDGAGNRWIDITAPTMRQWIEANVIDPNRPGKWIGETDYVGPCDEDGSEHDWQPDADCDRWFDIAGHDNCPGVFNPNQEPGPDADGDGDGVIDTCDNCPARPNVAPGSYQLDTDGDHVGDACDKCKNSNVPGSVGDFKCCNTDDDCGYYHSNHCVPFNPLAFPNVNPACQANQSRCAASPDSDIDTVGDACDNCPNVVNWDQGDTDSDGVGDFCDNCPGKHSFGHMVQDDPVPCNFGDLNSVAAADVFCQSLVGGDTKARCVPPHDGKPAACTHKPDTDHDGLADDCDDCKSVKNPGPFLGHNCNLESEQVAGIGYPYVGDACDPEPCVWFDAMYDRHLDPPNVWITFGYYPILLPQGADGFKYSYGKKSPKATVGARYCPCGDGTNPPDVALCSQTMGCKLEDSGAAYYDTATAWRKPHLASSVSTAYVNEFTFLPGPPTPNSSAFFLADYDTDYPVYWNVTADGAGPIPGAGPDNMGVSAVFWTHVTQLANATPALAADLPNHYAAGLFGRPGLDLAEEFPTIPIGPALLEDIKNCPECSISIDQPWMGIDPIDQRLVIRAHDFSRDVSARVTPGVVSRLASLGSANWLTVEESGAFRIPAGPRFAAIATDATGVPAAVSETSAGFVLANQRATGGLLRVAAETDPGVLGEEAPAPRSNFGAILSAAEGGVFVVGGVLLDGTNAEDIWHHNVKTSAWSKLSYVGPRPQSVLAATYRASDRSLFVLDENSVGHSAFARLLRIDLAKGQSAEVGRWPRRKFIDRVFMSIGPNDEMVILGSSTSKQRYFGVVLSSKEAGAVPAGGVVGKGTLAFKPTLSRRGLTIPLFDGDTVANEFVAWDSLRHHGNLGVAECL